MRTFANPLRIGDVERYYVRGTQPVCDVSVGDGGYYVAVPIRCYGHSSLFPVKKGDKVHLYFPDGSTDLPYIVGVDYSGKLPASSDDPSTDSDYAPSLEDAVLTHSGSRLSLSKYGITLEPNGSLRVQLAGDQVFRVSVEGDADDNALKGQQFIDALFPLLEDYNARLYALEQWVLATVSAVQAKYNAPTTGAGGATPITAVDLSAPYVLVIGQVPSVIKVNCESTKSDHVVIQ
jgi:hypothetical protein